MEYIKNYNNYSDDLIIEKLNLQSLLDTFKSLNNRKVSTFIVGSLLTVMTVTQTINYISNLNLNSSQKSILIQNVDKFKDPLSFGVSKLAYEHIKNHEKLKLKAYTINDGKITIGYGHAEPIRNSKFKIGQEITEEKADELLNQDVKTAYEGVRRIFKEWLQKGIKIKLTQSQFDVLVSLAFNMGIDGLRTSEFIQALKNKDLKAASELIKITGLRDGFAGLVDRREEEYNIFIS